MRVVVATKNKGKIKEISAILSPLGFDVVSQNDVGIDVEVEETGSTFQENAEIKARAVSMLCSDCVIADDSGLCVDALDCAPGIYSARYAGEGASDSDKIKKLLSELENVEDRKAKFVSSIVFLYPDGRMITTVGEAEGRILKSPEGDGGFGYDPIFYSDELQKPFGVATEEEKNKVSHRAKALAKLYEILNREKGEV